MGLMKKLGFKVLKFIGWLCYGIVLLMMIVATIHVQFTFTAEAGIVHIAESIFAGIACFALAIGIDCVFDLNKEEI